MDSLEKAKERVDDLASDFSEFVEFKVNEESPNKAGEKWLKSVARLEKASVEIESALDEILKIYRDQKTKRTFIDTED